MTIDVYFESAAVMNVQQDVTIAKGKRMSLVFTESEGIEVFANHDKVLEHEQSGNVVTVDAVENGSSLIRFMRGDETVRRIAVTVVTTVSLPAETINATFGAPVPK